MSIFRLPGDAPLAIAHSLLPKLTCQSSRHLGGAKPCPEKKWSGRGSPVGLEAVLGLVLVFGLGQEPQPRLEA